MELYEYEPIPHPTSIRLITVKANDKSKSLVCRFEIADISVPPKYIALSYAWGDTSNTATIICHGKAIQVTQTLQAALLRLAPYQIPVWADALSIDQRNITEKTQQVNMMGAIYGKAAGVMIWLGPDPYNDAQVVFEGTKRLIEVTATIHAMGGQFSYLDNSTGGIHWKLPDGHSVVSALPSIFVDPNDEEKARVQRFFRLPWFSRTWVMQECGLASHALVLWGDHVVKWNPIGVAAIFLLRYCRPSLDNLDISPDVVKVRDLYTTFSPFVPGASFFHLLNTARRCNTTDPRDKVFALLSHPTARTISPWYAAPRNRSAFEPYIELVTHLLPRLDDKFLIKKLAQTRVPSSKDADRAEPLLKADYSRTLEEVYLELAWDHIKRTETLEILTAVQHDPKSPSDLFSPSWVPRWNYLVDAPILGLYNSRHFASANRSAIVTRPPVQDPNTLIVRGTLFSRIINHTKLLTSSDFDLSLSSTACQGPESPLVQAFWTSNPLASTWLTFGLAQLHEGGHEYPQIATPFIESAHQAYALVPKSSSLHEAYLRTWVSGTTGAEVDDFDYQADSSAYWDRLFWGTLGNPNREVEDRKSSNEEVHWRRYRDNAAVVCNQRKFFLTQKGFFGLGPGALKRGDRVAVLLGSDAPFVIREANADALDPTKPVPQDTKFKLVGECYVHGLMEGQAVRDKEIERNIILQ